MTRTPEQNEAITAMAKDLCVDAAAGSGKTSVLIERIIHLIAGKRASLDQIVAITFTEAAAAEMKIRLRQAFRKSAPADDPAEMSRWRDMERWVDNARIATIHAFCAGLLRESALRIGMDPDFVVLADAEATLLRSETIADALHDLLEKKDPAAVHAATELGVTRLINELDRMLNKRRPIELVALDHPLHDANALQVRWKEMVMRAETQFFAFQAGAPEVRRMRDDLALFEGKCTAANDGREIARLLMSDALDNILERKEPAAICSALREVAGFSFSKCRASKKNWDCEEGFEALKILQEQIRKYADDCLLEEIDEATESKAAQLTCDIFATYESVNTAFAAAKQARGGLDFDDLMMMALRVLRDDAEVRGRVARGIKFLLIDEFQDTDSTQLEIARLIADHPEGPDLFVVGDAKQSIYDFRGAEVEVFQQAKDAATDHVVVLDKNFRTLPDVMAFINETFHRTGLLHAVEPVYNKLATSRDPVGECRVEFLITHDEDETARNEFRSAEAELIAARIDQMVNSNEPAQVCDEPRKQFRPARFGDIALLFRATSSIHLYEQSLRKCGIPYNVVAGEGYYRRQEILDLKNLIALLVDPWDELALLAFLRGPLCGLTDESLARLSMRQPLAPAFYSGVMPDHFDQTDCLDRAKDLIADLRDHSQLPLPDFVRYLLEITGYEAIALSQFLGVKKASNVRKLLDLADDFARTSPPTLAAFVHYLDTIALEDIREGDAVLQSSDSGAVTLMTIHKSKGLEFPIVVVPDISRDLRPPDSPDIEVHRWLGMAARTCDALGKTVKPQLYEAIYREQKLKGLAEHARVFYVAMTRARDWLLFSGCPKPGNNSWMSALDTQYNLLGKADGETITGDGWKAVIRRAGETLLKTKPLEKTISISMPDLEKHAAQIEQIQRTRNVFSVSELLDCMHDAPDPEQSPPSNIGAERAMLRGTLVHRMLELWDFKSDPLIDSLLRQEFPECLEMDGMREGLEDIAKRFIQSALGKRVLASAAPIEREAQFLLRIDDAFVRGTIDALLPDGSFLDYKTGAVHADKLARYQSQLQLYALAVQQILKKTPPNAWLFYVDSGEEHAVPLSPEMLDATLARARQAMGRLATRI